MSAATSQTNPTGKIETVVEADALLGRMAARRAWHDEREAKMNRALSAIRARFEPELKSAAAEIEAGKKKLEDWAEANRREFGDRKSMELLHGTIGFRTSPPALKLLSKMTWERVLDRMSADWAAYIKIVRDVDRKALLAAATRDEDPLARESLAQIGVKLSQEEKFFADYKKS